MVHTDIAVIPDPAERIDHLPGRELHVEDAPMGEFVIGPLHPINLVAAIAELMRERMSCADSRNEHRATPEQEMLPQCGNLLARARASVRPNMSTPIMYVHATSRGFIIDISRIQRI